MYGIVPTNHKCQLRMLELSVQVTCISPRSIITQLFTWHWCSGLAISNQHTSILLVLPLAACVVLDRCRTSGGGILILSWHVFLLGLCGLAGLLPYVYLPMSSRGVFQQWQLFPTQHNSSALDVGSWGDTGSWNGFWAHFLRSEYVHV